MPRLVSVAVPVPGLDLLTYSLPDDLDMPSPGVRVLVPLGTRVVTGCLVGEAAAPEGSRGHTQLNARAADRRCARRAAVSARRGVERRQMGSRLLPGRCRRNHCGSHAARCVDRECASGGHQSEGSCRDRSRRAGRPARDPEPATGTGSARRWAHAGPGRALHSLASRSLRRRRRGGSQNGPRSRARRPGDDDAHDERPAIGAQDPRGWLR